SRTDPRGRRTRGGVLTEVGSESRVAAMADTRILVAEDETITRMDLREMLENLGYSVVGEAGDGVAAVNLARALKPDLVLMDIKMPGLDGIAAAQTLAQEHVTPVLLLTG